MPNHEKPNARPPVKFNRACLDRVIQNLGEGLQTHPAIEKAGISIRHFYREIKKHPEWAKTFKEAQIERDQIKNERRIEAAEAELYRRAVDGWDQQVFDEQGRLKGSRRRYSDQCLLFLLRKLKSDRYGDNPTLLHNEVKITQDEQKSITDLWRESFGLLPRNKKSQKEGSS